MSQGVKVNHHLLKRARLRKGWSVREVSKRCEEIGIETGSGVKVDFGNVSRYERGRVLPVPQTLFVLAQALDLTVDELLDEKEPAA